MLRLRWRFEYTDGKPPKYGQWDRHGDRPEDQAWSQDKINLARAVIEAKGPKGIVQVAEMPGQDFMNFAWHAFRNAPILIRGVSKEVCTISGLMVVGRYTRISVFKNGTVEEEKTPESYHRLELAGYGR